MDGKWQIENKRNKLKESLIERNGEIRKKKKDMNKKLVWFGLFGFMPYQPL